MAMWVLCEAVRDICVENLILEHKMSGQKMSLHMVHCGFHMPCAWAAPVAVGMRSESTLLFAGLHAVK